MLDEHNDMLLLSYLLTYRSDHVIIIFMIDL